jgi:hypothetical protein
LLDQLADMVTDGLGGVRVAAPGRRDRRREEVAQLEDAARRLRMATQAAP